MNNAVIITIFQNWNKLRKIFTDYILKNEFFGLLVFVDNWTKISYFDQFHRNILFPIELIITKILYDVWMINHFEKPYIIICIPFFFFPRKLKFFNKLFHKLLRQYETGDNIFYYYFYWKWSANIIETIKNISYDNIFFLFIFEEWSDYRFFQVLQGIKGCWVSTLISSSPMRSSVLKVNCNQWNSITISRYCEWIYSLQTSLVI